ncbi:MAG: hypothetical protein U0547_00775 [Dehalococcoidia bacterium]
MAALAPGFGATTDHRGLPTAFALGAAVSLVTFVVFGPGMRHLREKRNEEGEKG